MLKLTLERARALGLAEVTLCADADNVRSLKVIEANGGIFEEELPVTVHGEAVTRRRYRRLLTESDE